MCAHVTSGGVDVLGRSASRYKTPIESIQLEEVDPGGVTSMSFTKFTGFVRAWTVSTKGHRAVDRVGVSPDPPIVDDRRSAQIANQVPI